MFWWVFFLLMILGARWLFKLFEPDEYQKAWDQFSIQFPHLKAGASSNGYYMMWDVATSITKYKRYSHVLIVNYLTNNRLVRNEWYEYNGKEWIYVGYLTREDCVKVFKWQAMNREWDAWEEAWERGEKTGFPVANEKDRPKDEERYARSIVEECLSEYRKKLHEV